MVFPVYMNSISDIKNVCPMSCVNPATMNQGDILEFYFFSLNIYKK